MSAPSGNKFWEARSSHGRKPLYEDAEKLLDACNQYFAWNHENPLFEMKPFNVNGEIIQEPVSVMRAMTLKSLCRYIGMSYETWQQYRVKEDFSAICKEVEDIIYDQKLQGAAAGLLSASIIQRDLGLKEKTESESKVQFDLSNLSDEELEAIAGGKIS